MALSKYQQLAQETLEIIEKGFYVSPRGRKVSIKDQVQYSVANTILYTPKMTDEVLACLAPSERMEKTNIVVTNETSLSAAKRMKEEGAERVIGKNRLSICRMEYEAGRKRYRLSAGRFYYCFLC